MKKMAYLKDVVTLEINSEACTGCGMCVQVCPHGVFVLRDGTVSVDHRDYCMECGACTRNCPLGAINVRAGVGCAYAIIVGAIRGTEPDCSCCCGGDDTDPGCC